MLDSIDQMTFKLYWNHIFGVKTLGFCHMRYFNSVISFLLYADDVVLLADME